VSKSCLIVLKTNFKDYSPPLWPQPKSAETAQLSFFLCLRQKARVGDEDRHPMVLQALERQVCVLLLGVGPAKALVTTSAAEFRARGVAQLAWEVHLRQQVLHLLSESGHGGCGAASGKGPPKLPKVTCQLHLS
jgi:hypothetical protein